MVADLSSISPAEAMSTHSTAPTTTSSSTPQQELSMNMSFVYYVNNNRKQVKKLVDLDIPLPQTTWFRNPVANKKKSGLVEELSDSIHSALKELDVEPETVAPTFSLSDVINISSSCSIDDDNDDDIDEDDDNSETQVFSPRHHRQRRRRSSSWNHNKKRPPRAVSVPSRVYLVPNGTNTNNTDSNQNNNSTRTSRSSCKSVCGPIPRTPTSLRRTRKCPAAIVIPRPHNRDLSGSGSHHTSTSRPKRPTRFSTAA